MSNAPPPLSIDTRFRRARPDQIAALRGVPTSHVCDALSVPDAVSAIPLRPIAFGPRPSGTTVGSALVVDNAPGDVLGTLATLHYVRPGDIVVAAVGGHDGCAAAGDVIATSIRAAGGAALVTDGPMRDRRGVIDSGLPVWCRGLHPDRPTAEGPAQVGGAVTMCGVTVRSGDLVVADDDGVVAIASRHLDDLIARLDRIDEAERSMRRSINDGPASLLDLDHMIRVGQAHVMD